MTFIETSVFTKHIQEYLSDDEYAALQHFLNWQPEAWDIVPASGGVRKLRWAMQGRGKRGGTESSTIGKNLSMKFGC